MPRKNSKEMYERISPYVEHYAREYYGGNEAEGFRHWAFSEKFLEHDLSDTDVIDRTSIDGSDDFEVDGYLIEDSEESKAIHLFQCKHRNPGASMSSKELSSFLEAPTKLLNPQMVVTCRNSETKNLHDQLVKLIPQGYSIDLTWVTSGRLSPQARLYARDSAIRNIPFKIGDATYDVNISFEALDISDLDSLFQSHLESDDSSLCNYTFGVDSDRCHEVSGAYKTLVLTLPAKQIIDVFGEHRYKIFHLTRGGHWATRQTLR